MQIHVLQHVPFEGPGTIEEWAIREGHSLTLTRFYAQEPFPPLDRFDMLLVLGGPMSIHDEHRYPWLKGEKWFVQQVIESGKPVLGICLGAQLIAQVLGAEVYPGAQKEIGWFPITLTPEFGQRPLGQQLPATMTAFHWHGETFSLPQGAQRIASSAVCENQGFIYEDRVIALQFHLEATPAAVQNLIDYCGDELVNAPYIQSGEAMLSNIRYYTEIREAMEPILAYLANRAQHLTY